jgi:hypothetical protein
MDLRRELRRSGVGLGCNVGCRVAAEAVAAARKALVVLVVMVRRGFSVVVGVPLRAGLGVRGRQMKRGMRVAVRKRERQQYDQAAEERRPHHCNAHIIPRDDPKVLQFRHSTPRA